MDPHATPTPHLEMSPVNMRRPQKKLNFLTSKESSANQWAVKTKRGPVQDIDRLFDDLDSASDCENDILPLCDTFSVSKKTEMEKDASLFPLQTPLTKKNTQSQKPLKGDVLDKAVNINSHQDIVIDSDSPFREHGPIRTSSPIELIKEIKEHHCEKERAVSPVLLLCENDVQEDLKKLSTPIQKPQCIVQITEPGNGSYSSRLSHPKTFALSKLKASSTRKGETCNKTGPVAEKAAQQCPTPAVDAQGQPLLRRELQHSHKETPSVSKLEKSTRVDQELTAFLQKLKHPGKTKPPCSREPVSPMKVPMLVPEPEDDFMILEEEVPLWFSLPRRGDSSSSRSRRKPSKPSTDREGTKKRQLEEAGTQPQSGPLGYTTTEEGPSNPPKPKKKGKPVSSAKKTAVKKAVLIRPSDEMNEDFPPCQEEEMPADDVTEHDKQQTEISKASHAAVNEVQPEESPVAESVKEKSVLLETKDKKTKRFSRAKKDNNTKDRVKSVHLNRKASQEDNLESGSECPEGTARLHSPGKAAGQSCGPVTKTVKPQGQRKWTSKDAAIKKPEQTRPSSSGETDSSEGSQDPGKRKRRTPGEWWLIGSQSPEQTKDLEDPPVLKKSKQIWKVATSPSPVQAMQSGSYKEQKKMPSALPVSQTTGRKMAKKGKLAKIKDVTEKPARRQKDNLADEIRELEKREETSETNLDPVELSPTCLPVKEHRPNTGHKVFDRIYQRTPNKKAPSATVSTTATIVAAHAVNSGPEKLRRRQPNNWEVNNVPDDTESLSYQPERPKAANLKKHWRDKTLTSVAPENHDAAVSSKSPALVKQKHPPKTIKCSLATFKDVFIETTCIASSKTASMKRLRAAGARSECPTEDHANDGPSDLKINETDSARVVEYAPIRKRLSWPSSLEIQDRLHSGSILQGFKSGPSSMIEPNREGSFVEFPKATTNALCPTELCGVPLVPLVLQEEDKANITEWLSLVWPATGTNPADASQTTPDNFQWFSHRGRALGFHVDLYTDYFCSGKILLGSCMKKPLWVDHSAVTVFNVFTSCVSATVNGTETRYNPGRSFMVPCGQAYSLKNLTAEPAVLYFNRMLSESTD